MSQPLTGSARAAALDAFRKKGRKSPVTAATPAPDARAGSAEKSRQNERQAPQTGLGHPAAREATHSSTTAAETLAYMDATYPLSEHPERRAMRERLRAHVERLNNV